MLRPALSQHPPQPRNKGITRPFRPLSQHDLELGSVAFMLFPFHKKATSNKCHASSNRCLTWSNSISSLPNSFRKTMFFRQRLLVFVFLRKPSEALLVTQKTGQSVDRGDIRFQIGPETQRNYMVSAPALSLHFGLQSCCFFAQLFDPDPTNSCRDRRLVFLF